MAKRYRREYKKGGQRVPGMFRANEGVEMNTPPSPPPPSVGSGINLTESQLHSLKMSNLAKQDSAQRMSLVNSKMQQMLQQMKLQNDSLKQQNELLMTQIQKNDLINSARTTKEKPGSKKTPKRRGGMVKARKGKEKLLWFGQSSGTTMRRGGSCGTPKGLKRR